MRLTAVSAKALSGAGSLGSGGWRGWVMASEPNSRSVSLFMHFA